MVLDLAAKTKATAAARASSSADDDQDLDGFKIADPTNNSEKKKMRLSKEANIMLAGIVNSKISKKPAADIKRAACSRKVPPEKTAGGQRTRRTTKTPANVQSTILKKPAARSARKKSNQKKTTHTTLPSKGATDVSRLAVRTGVRPCEHAWKLVIRWITQSYVATAYDLRCVCPIHRIRYHPLWERRASQLFCAIPVSHRLFYGLAACTAEELSTLLPGEDLTSMVDDMCPTRNRTNELHIQMHAVEVVCERYMHMCATNPEFYTAIKSSESESFSDEEFLMMNCDSPPIGFYDWEETQMSGSDVRERPETPAETKEANIMLALNKFSDDSTLFGFHGEVDAVIQAIYEHAASPSVFDKHAEARDELCAQRHAKDSKFPAHGKALDVALGVKGVMSDEEAGACDSPFRRASYMKRGAVLEYVAFMDTYCSWRKGESYGGKYGDLTINITNATGFDFPDANVKYECEITWTQAPADFKTPFDVFPLPSLARSGQFPLVNIQKLSTKTVKVRFEGNTFNFREGFTRCSIPGRYENKEGDAVPAPETAEEKKVATYIRIIKCIDVEVSAARDFLLGVFGDLVYKGTLVKVVWSGDCAEDEPVHAFQTALRAVPNVSLRA